MSTLMMSPTNCIVPYPYMIAYNTLSVISLRTTTTTTTATSNRLSELVTVDCSL